MEVMVKVQKSDERNSEKDCACGSSTNQGIQIEKYSKQGFFDTLSQHFIQIYLIRWASS